VNPGSVFSSVFATTGTARLGEAVGSGLLLFMVLIALASPLVYRGWQTRKKYREITGLPSLSSTTVSDGELTKLAGQIKETDERITSPVQSTRCELAFWKVATLRRYDTFNHMSYWSVAGIGIDAETLVIAGETQDIRISNVSREKNLSAADELKHLLGSDENSILDSIATELDPPEFEDRRTPSEERPQKYDELAGRINFEAETPDSPGFFGWILNAVRTPEGTVQFQETTMSAGDTVTVVGRVVDVQNGRVRLQGSESIDPTITQSSPSELEAKHRRAYLIQLYAIPLFVTALSSLAAVGVLL
jgi:hypothetical protein